MGPFRQTELSQDERLSPIKFSGLRKGAGSDHKTRIEELSEQIEIQPDLILQDKNLSRANNSPGDMLLSRRNTISSANALKTPSRVQKVTSLTSPRRNYLSSTVKVSVKSPSRIPNGQKFAELQKRLNSQITLTGADKSNSVIADSFKKTSTAEVLPWESSDDVQMHGNNLSDFLTKSNMDSVGESNEYNHGTDSHQRISSGSRAHDKENNSLLSSEARRKSSQLSIDYDESKFQISEPMYSLLQFREIQEDHALRIKDLESVISEKNTELNKLVTRMTDLKNQHVLSQESLIKKQNELNHVMVQEKALHFQLNQYSIDLNRTQELLKLRTQSLQTTEASIVEMKEMYESKIAQGNQACSLSNQRLEETEMKLVEANLNMASLEKELTDMKTNILELKEERVSLERQFESITMEKEATLASHLALQDEILASKTRINTLETEIREKDASLHSLTEKFGNLVKEAEILHEDMLNFETEQRIMESDISAKSEKIHELQANEQQLKELLLNQDQQLKTLIASERDLKAQIQAKEKNLLESLQRVIDLEAQNDEKDKIISGDTRKLTELVQQVTEQKNVISDQKAQLLSLDKDAELSTRESEDIIMKLKRQISLAQEKTDQRIQEVAEQLYHQYSKKHEAKVTQLKLKFESKLEERGEELERNERLVESLRSQLQTEMKEKTYLLSVLEKGDKHNTNSITFHDRSVS